MNKQFCPYCMNPVEPDQSCTVCGLTGGNYTPAPHHLLPGTVLTGRYLVGRVLGEGGFGITYIGCDLRLELKVAIKEYFPTDRATRQNGQSSSVHSYSGSAGRSFESGKKKFLQEARTMARMDKLTQIVSVRDYFEENNTAYIVMEYVEGTDLKTLVAQRGGRIQPEELLPMMEPLFFALREMHRLGLLHRDISPDNVMLEDGMVRLIDFGCARESPEGGETLTIALKQGYAPIEQYQQKGQGPWTDVYALAATIYYCLTGQAPPRAVDRVLEDELVPPRQLGVALTEAQEAALEKALSVLPRSRFRSAETFHAALYAPEPDPIPIPVPDPIPDPVPAPDPTPEPISDPVPISQTQNEPLVPAVEIFPTVTTPQDDSAAQTRTEETQSQTKTPTARLLAFVQAHKPACAAGAALLLILALAILVPKGGGTEENTEDDTVVTDTVDTLEKDQEGFAESASPSEESETPEEGSDTDAAGSAGETRTVTSLEEFQAALADETVSAIVLDGGIDWPASAGILEIGKPVTVNGSIGTEQAVKVGAGGHLQVAGTLSTLMLYVADGGSVTVEDGGVLCTWKIWAEQESDLTLENGATLDIYGQSTLDSEAENYIVLSEDALFADAVSVSTWDGLREALEDSATTSVIIQSGSEIVLEEHLSHSVPVLIEEGATVTAANAETSWFVDSTELVNRGTLTAEVFGESYSDGRGLFTIVNYGIFDGMLSLEDYGNFLNLGTMRSGTVSAKYGDFVNLGTVELSGGTDSYYDFRENDLLNFGTLTLDGAASADGTYLTTNYRMRNAGTIEVGAAARLEIDGILENSGTLSLTAETAELQNNGCLRNLSGSSQILAVSGSTLYGPGVILYTEESSLPMDFLADEVCLVNTSGNDAAYVTSQKELEVALQTDAISAVVVDMDLTVTGDLTVGKRLVCYGALTVEGSLTVTGSDAALYAGDVLTVDGAVNISDGAAVVCMGGYSLSGDVTVQSGGRLYGSPYGGLELGGSITLLDSSRLVLIEGYLSLVNTEVIVGDGSQLVVLGSLNLQGGSTLTIAETGSVQVYFQDFILEGGSTLVNAGSLDLQDNHWLHTIELAGTVENTGSITVWANHLILSGEITNYGTIQVDQDLILDGTLKNYGEVRFVEGSEGMPQVVRGSTGMLIGHQPEVS